MSQHDREQKTVAAMVRLFCRFKHGGVGLCAECAELAAFAAERLQLCPVKHNKPVCSECAVHCYRSAPDLRERMRAVMRYAGPRMLIFHPLLALRHQLDRLCHGFRR